MAKRPKKITFDRYMMALLKQYQDEVNAARQQLSDQGKEETPEIYAAQGALSAAAFLAGVTQMLVGQHKARFPAFTAQQYKQCSDAVTKIMEDQLLEMRSDNENAHDD
jgi:hypothetical protein